MERVGSDKPIPLDVRVLAATHRDLHKLASEGKFRQDLLYRLNVVPISVHLAKSSE
jgi:formate hydrogenlyase transcriptional activator